jgi:flagellar M-ring protein FliF
MAFKDIVGKMSIRSWAIIGGSVAVSLIFITLLINVASAPSYSTLLTGISPTQTGKITAQLATSGIPYELQSGGTAVAVPASDTSQARVALAGADLLTPSTNDDANFTKSTLGESDSQEQVQYQIALEQQLADTIDQVQGVSGAQVELALPNPNTEVFADSSQSATAAVLLSGGSALDPSAVRGIAEMVASSVQGLNANKVTITSDTGELLWPNSASGSGGGALALENAESSYDQTQEAQLNAMLANTLGAGMASVVVNAQINDNSQTVEALKYTGAGVPLTKSTTSENLTNKGGGTTGTAATTIPAYAQTSSGNSKYTNTSTQATLGVNKTVTSTTIAPGALLGDSVSVLVSSKVPPAELAAITPAVQAAAGITPADLKSPAYSVVVKSVKFPSTTVATGATSTTAASPTSGMMAYAKDGIIGLGAVIFLFFVTRMLRRRENEHLARQPTWLRELEQPRSLIELEEEGAAAAPLRVKRLRPPAASTAEVQVEDLVKREPERVASQVRDWMSED